MRAELRYDKKARLNDVPVWYYVSGDPFPTLGKVRGGIVFIDDRGSDKTKDELNGAYYDYEMRCDHDSMALRIAVIAAAAVPITGAYWAAETAYKADVIKTKKGYLTHALDWGTRAKQNYENGRQTGESKVWKNEGYSNEKSGKEGEPTLKIIGTNVNTAGNLGPLSPWISTYSSAINEWLKQYDFRNGSRYGWISMDHPIDALTRKIIATNEINTSRVTVDIEWADGYAYRHDNSELGDKAFFLDGAAAVMSWKKKDCAEVKLTSGDAEKLEKGMAVLSVNPAAPLFGQKTPVTVYFEHICENHWKCVIYPEIKITVHWDFCTPASTGALLSSFFKANYENGEYAGISARNLHVYNSDGNTTILYLSALPVKSGSGRLILDIPYSTQKGYRYDSKTDRVQKDVLNWEFTLHPDVDAADYKGSVKFIDADDKYGLRPAETGSFRTKGLKLVATGSLPGTASSTDDPVVYELPLTLRGETYAWERKGLSLSAEGYDLT